MKALLTVGVTAIALLVVSAPEVKAGQTCTPNGSGGWDCVEDKETTQPSCVGNGPFECSKPAPAGLFLSSNGYNPAYKVEAFNPSEVNIELALTCGIDSKKVTNKKGEEYCQSTNIGG
jgi:hypothetical protein